MNGTDMAARREIKDLRELVMSLDKKLTAFMEQHLVTAAVQVHAETPDTASPLPRDETIISSRVRFGEVSMPGATPRMRAEALGDHRLARQREGYEPAMSTYAPLLPDSEQATNRMSREMAPPTMHLPPLQHSQDYRQLNAANMCAASGPLHWARYANINGQVFQVIAVSQQQIKEEPTIEAKPAKQEPESGMQSAPEKALYRSSSAFPESSEYSPPVDIDPIALTTIIDRESPPAQTSAYHLQDARPLAGAQMWRVPVSVLKTRKENSACADMPKKIFERLSMHFTRVWSCSVSAALPARFHQATPYSLVLVIKLAAFAQDAVDIDEAHPALVREWRKRVGNLQPGPAAEVVTRVPQHPKGMGPTGHAEKEIRENFRGVMLCDIAAAHHALLTQRQGDNNALKRKAEVEDEEPAPQAKKAKTQQRQAVPSKKQQAQQVVQGKNKPGKQAVQSKKKQGNQVAPGKKTKAPKHQQHK
ncbi:hypothetical protein LTR53_014510 [Teratosphaeriaceae sp. CCFEE 6253]|nr:hypothetical protein LTR53_014510 [Teratosphaeriaceae sp. CCFEE 6253]